MHYGRRRPGWVPREPAHTCPSIDEAQAELRERATRLEEEAQGLRKLADQLEELRKANSGIREWGVEIVDAAESEMDDLREKVRDLEKARGMT